MADDDVSLRLVVEHCIAPRGGCNQSLRGSAERYVEMAAKLCSAFQAAFTQHRRTAVAVNGASSSRHPRLGAFEVSIEMIDRSAAPQKALVFSKLQTLKWPCVKLLIARIFSLMPHVADPPKMMCLALQASNSPAVLPAPSSEAHTTPAEQRSPSPLDLPCQAPAPKALPSAPSRKIGATPAQELPRPSARVQPWSSDAASTVMTPGAHRARAPRPPTPSRLRGTASRQIRLDLKFRMLAFDAQALRCGISQILAIGDCHGGRTAAHLSQLVQTHFIYGCMHSWASGKRTLPPLHALLLPARQALSGSGSASAPSPGAGAPHASLRGMGDSPIKYDKAVCLFSYGTRDCRLHASKWIDDPDAIAVPYAVRVKEYAASGCARSARTVIPVILACPPAVDYREYNPGVEANGELSIRMQAVQQLNRALARACDAHGVLFTGIDTWAFAQTHSGSLRPELSSSGHSTIDPGLCAPVHETLRRCILAAVGVSPTEGPEPACDAARRD